VNEFNDMRALHAGDNLLGMWTEIELKNQHSSPRKDECSHLHTARTVPISAVKNTHVSTRTDGALRIVAHGSVLCFMLENAFLCTGPRTS